VGAARGLGYTGGVAKVRSMLQFIEEFFLVTKFQGRGAGMSLYMSKVIMEKQMVGSFTIRNAGNGVEVRIKV